MVGVSTPPVHPVIPRYTVHERALYFNSTFFHATFVLDMRETQFNCYALYKIGKSMRWLSSKKNFFLFVHTKTKGCCWIGIG